MYACADADMTLRLHAIVRGELIERNQLELYEKLEVPLCPCSKTWRCTVLVDVPHFEEMSRDIGSQRQAGTGHLPARGASVQSELAQTTGGGARTQPSVVRKDQDGSVYRCCRPEQLRDAHPMVGLLLEYRNPDKLRGTYVDALPRLVHPRTDGYTSYNQVARARQALVERSESAEHSGAHEISEGGALLLRQGMSSWDVTIRVELRMLATFRRIRR